jgi:hypothetical protein
MWGGLLGGQSNIHKKNTTSILRLHINIISSAASFINIIISCIKFFMAMVVVVSSSLFSVNPLDGRAA